MDNPLDLDVLSGTGNAEVVITLPIDIIEVNADAREGEDALKQEDVHFPEPVVLPPIIELKQPLESILANTKVQIFTDAVENPDTIRASINSLDILLGKLTPSNVSKLGISPGFDTCGSTAVWTPLDGIFEHYQTLDSINNSSIGGNAIPMPCPEVAYEYYLLIKDAWQERLVWATLESSKKKDKCSCIGMWQHKPVNVLRMLSNQVIEQLMSREASACLHQPNLPSLWATCYTSDKCPGPGEMLYLDASVRVLVTRGEYIYNYVASALQATSTIDISICYLFHSDPAAKYILLDLLPFIAKKGVNIRILFESMTLESQNLQSVFEVMKPQTGCPEEEPLKYALPEGSPSFYNAKKKFCSASELVREVLDISSTTPNINCKYWVARDNQSLYRIKNHTKAHIFDGGMNGTVIAGGSNVVPRPNSLDTDFLLTGEVACLYQLHFDNLWRAMSPAIVSMSLTVEEGKKEEFDEMVLDIHVSVGEEKKESDIEMLDIQTNLSANDNKSESSPAKILFAPSVPSSSGEDVILRCVLGAIKHAQKSIVICMGHCNVPVFFAHALREATERGVKVSFLTNSLYSCDLRCGQRDLIISLQQLLVIAPKVELFVTAPKPSGEGVPFLHSKYVVVDSEWTAVGSWNLWTRAAFYEMEGEIFVVSASFASDLEEKFHMEKEAFAIPVKTATECMRFLPSGCAICTQFGPFFQS